MDFGEAYLREASTGSVQGKVRKVLVERALTRIRSSRR
jgi:hypothetical protein